MDPGSGVFNILFPNSSGLSGPYVSFVLKLSPSGNFMWADGFHGSTLNSLPINAVSTDSYNNVYCTTGFQDTVDFDPSVFVYSLTAIGNKDAAIIKLNSSGGLINVLRFGAPNAFCTANCLSVGKLGNIYWSGNLKGNSVDLNPGSGIYNVTPNPNAMFISKLDASLVFQWAGSYDIPALQYSSYYFALDANENIYAKGNFSTTVDFDPSVGTYYMNSMSGADIFITKLNNAGGFVWAKQIGNSFTTASNQNANYITLDNLGNVYTSGQFLTLNGTNSYPCDFDPGSIAYSFISNGNYDTFIHKLDNNGNFLLAKHMGGSGLDYGTALAVDNNFNVYTIGAFSNLVDFDPGIGIQNLNSPVGLSGFIQKLSPCNAPAQPILNSYGNCAAHSVTLAASGSGTVTWCNNSAIANSVSATGFTYFTNPLNVGVYTFYAASNNTCASSQPLTPITISVVPNQTVNVPLTSFSICVGENCTLTASGASNYTWALTTSTVMQTVIIQPTISVSATLTASGNSTNCPAVQIVNITVNKCLNIENTNTVFKHLAVFPNPVKELLHVELEILNENTSAVDIEISNALGQIVYSEKLTQAKTDIYTAHWAKGIYFMKVKDAEKEGVKRIVVE